MAINATTRPIMPITLPIFTLASSPRYTRLLERRDGTSNVRICYRKRPIRRELARPEIEATSLQYPAGPLLCFASAHPLVRHCVAPWHLRSGSVTNVIHVTMHFLSYRMPRLAHTASALASATHSQRPRPARSDSNPLLVSYPPRLVRRVVPSC